MASAAYADASESEDDFDSDQSSELDTNQDSVNKPCRYYNSGSCRNGANCSYLHACRFYLKGNCRYGSQCRLSHSVGGGASPGTNQSSTSTLTLTDGRCYQWQLNAGNDWKDVQNDHVIEAQYSLPQNKSIKLYNTTYGAVSIDFTKVKIYEKNLKVRRLDDGKTAWTWFCKLQRTWVKYGEKDSVGNPGPVSSSDIEKQFQSDPKSCFSFSRGGETFDIRFKEMQQVGENKRRKVCRRPEFRQQRAGTSIFPAVSALRSLSLGSKPQWQFEGDQGKWHEFKYKARGADCSVSSDDIEANYRLNPGVMGFQVNGQNYQLDFGAMIQTNLQTGNRRRIRRELV